MTMVPASTGTSPLEENRRRAQARPMETNTLPRIAVIYATAQGSTREIAEFIAANLTARGATVEVADAEHAPDLSRFDAVILGSAVHNRACYRRSPITSGRTPKNWPPARCGCSASDWVRRCRDRSAVGRAAPFRNR